jgi:hypothetical protein
MIVRPEDFIPCTSPILLDPDIPEEMKLHFKNAGMAESTLGTDCLEIVDDCFHCGEKLTTPYIYWQGAPESISLHQKCALKMILGLTQDAYMIAKGLTPASDKDAVRWLSEL